MLASPNQAEEKSTAKLEGGREGGRGEDISDTMTHISICTLKIENRCSLPLLPPTLPPSLPPSLPPHLAGCHPHHGSCPGAGLPREGEEGGEAASDQLQVACVNYPINCRGQLRKNLEGREMMCVTCDCEREEGEW